MNLFPRRTNQPKANRLKKQIYVDETQYREMKALLFMRGKTVSAWIAGKMAEEIAQEHAKNSRSNQ